MYDFFSVRVRSQLGLRVTRTQASSPALLSSSASGALASVRHLETAGPRHKKSPISVYVGHCLEMPLLQRLAPCPVDPPVSSPSATSACVHRLRSVPYTTLLRTTWFSGFVRHTSFSNNLSLFYQSHCLVLTSFPIHFRNHNLLLQRHDHLFLQFHTSCTSPNQMYRTTLVPSPVFQSNT